MSPTARRRAQQSLGVPVVESATVKLCQPRTEADGNLVREINLNPRPPSKEPPSGVSMGLLALIR